MSADLFSKLYHTLKNGKGAVLVRIVRREGSAPRGVGSVCMVDAEGTLTGTIGGGLLEYKAVEEARVLLEKRVTSLSTITMTAQAIADEGMICGGVVELFFEPILPEDTVAVEFFRAVDESFQSGERGTLTTLVRDGGDALAPDSRMLLKNDSTTIGNIPSIGLPGHASKASLVQRAGTEEWLFHEPVMAIPALLLFGGGHISTCVSPIAKILGFHVSVFDDRSDFANRKRFPEADEIHDMVYSKAIENISITGSSYIVIVTRGHGGDRDVLELVLNSSTTPAYIGMIGSLRKRDKIYDNLIENGMSKERLDKVHSPIGLNIGAQTPEEIAVSIMAEIIQVKAAWS